MLLGLMGLVLLVSLYVGSQWVEDMRRDLAESLARDRARITQQRILAKVGQELALSRRLAESAVFTEWLADEGNNPKQSRAWREAERFRLAFSDGNWSSASLATRHFHYADTQTPAPRLAYSFQDGNPENAWSTLVSQLEGHQRLLALAGAPTLGWTVVTAVGLDSSNVLTPHRLLVLGLPVMVLLTVFLVVVSAGLHAGTQRVLPLGRRRISGAVLRGGSDGCGGPGRALEEWQCTSSRRPR